jgi:hypothetical protein
MNAKRSSKFNLTRYVLLIPAVVVLLLIFSFSKTGIAKSKIIYKNIVSSSALKLLKEPSHEFAVMPKKPTVAHLFITKAKKHVAIDSTTPLSQKKDTVKWKIAYRINIVKEPVTDTTNERIRVKFASAKKDTAIALAYFTKLKEVAIKPKIRVVDIALTPPRNYTDFTGKLILVNGKEATEDEIKKLSVSDIKSITPFDVDEQSPAGSYYKKLYGEKAKNGVIGITLKNR